MAFRQVAFHMLRNPLKFYKYMEQEFAETGESYESYVTNIFRGKVWGDDLIAAAFGDMWNIAVSVVSPAYTKPQPLFHNKPKPDIVIVANGSCWRNGDDRTTHFSATSCYDKSYKVPGTEYSNPVIAMDKVPNTDPIILSDKNKASQVAIKEYLKSAEDLSLDLLRGVSLSINRLNGKIADIVSQVDDLNEEKKVLEYRLNRLGVAADRIKEAGQIEETQYCRTGEREKIDAEHAKRKREQEELEEEERKKIRIIPTVDGKYRRSYEIEGQEVETEDLEEITESANEKFLKKLVQQQKEQIQNQEMMLHQQGQEIEIQAANIRMMKERRKPKEEKDVTKPDEIIDLDDDAKVGIKSEPSTSKSTSFKLENVIKPEFLKYIPGYKPKVSQQEEDDKTGKSEELPATLSASSSGAEPNVNIFVPSVEREQNVVLLLETKKKKSTERCSGKTHPVPKGRRLDTKYYCEKCKSEYKRKDLLAAHIKNDCLQPIPQFICEKCNEGYFSERAVREHYYQIHIKKDLYYCKKCNKGFAHLSRKSTHNANCPNQDKPDKYPGRLPIDPELEATFKRRVIKPLEITEAVIEGQETQQNQPDVDVANQPGTLAEELTPKNLPQPGQVTQQGIGVDYGHIGGQDNVVDYGQGGEAVFGQNFDVELPTGLIQVNPIEDELLQPQQEVQNLDPNQLLLEMSEGKIVGAQTVMDNDDDDDDEATEQV